MTGAVGAALLQGLLGYALLVGLTVGMPVKHEDALKLFDILPDRPPPPPPPTVPRKTESHKPRGAAAPPNRKSRATEIVAKPPVVPLPAPPPVIAAPVAGRGSDPSAGAALRPGPGTGAGGQGTGTGAGGSGDGEGGDDTPPRQIKGRIKDSDYPRGAALAGAGGTVMVRFSVETDGRVGECVVTGSSGNADLDQTTCRLIRERFRYRPSLDASGRPVRSYVIEDHSWAVERGFAPSSDSSRDP
ncbi:energy transducer TonB [Flavisphingomonas formosensis]|uniref:energy transducer TonB n=1 Tax=Flavisphingomonas formosensis TaxID=861534 RepID=UPI001E31A6CC|nr:TonB family protein [Sphingomonas formosensis]